MEVAFIISVTNGLTVVVRVDFENGDGNFLSARSGKRDVNIAFCIERRDW